MMSRSILPLAAALLSLPAVAFHSGGVGHCGGCHVTRDATGVRGATARLVGEMSASDVCLNCHSEGSGRTWSQNPVLPPPQYGGGSFVFLTEDNLNDGPGGGGLQAWIPGHAAGHSVVARGRGAMPDPRFRTAPGGTYPSTALGCTSCHDPHGKQGHFRMLYGSDSPASASNGYTLRFRTPAPDAAGIDLSGPQESAKNHTAYRSGMSAWCGNCHGRYHEAGSGSSFTHPVDMVLPQKMLETYNRYRGTGFYDGTGLDAYLPLVPYEAPESTTSGTGPAPSNARMTCLTCHRAHASSAPAAGRWDFKISTWREEGLISGSHRIPNPFQATAGTGQRQLCEKCHGEAPRGGAAPGFAVDGVSKPRR